MSYWDHSDSLSILDTIHLTVHGIGSHFETYRAKINTAIFISNYSAWLSFDEYKAVRNYQPSFQHLLDLATLILLSRGYDVLKELDYETN